MNNTTSWYTALALILGAAVAAQLLADAGMLGNARPVLGCAVGALGLWLAGYGVLSIRQGIFDVLGPLLTFTRFQRPRLFAVLLALQFLLALALLWGAAGMFAPA